MEVHLDIDDAPRTVDVPEPLAAAFAADPLAARAWTVLSCRKQRAHAESIASAKAEATKAIRVTKVLAALRG